MRVLLDSCVPVGLAEHLPFDVTTAREMNWQHLKNGELLRASAAEFDVLLTSNKGMPFQQPLKSIRSGSLWFA